jgi:uncharacterized protein (UPF0548 family)
VFSLARPTAAAIEECVVAARLLPDDGPGFLRLPGGHATAGLARGFALDRSRTRIGQGEVAFAAAKRAFERWAMFDLGWVRVANSAAAIAPREIVPVEAHTLGLWTLNLSRITDVVNAGDLFGFIYSTTAMHVEQGEEPFLLEFDEATDDVWYELEAVSRPRSSLARLGFPVTRSFQHRFARDSHQRMRKETLGR